MSVSLLRLVPDGITPEFGRPAPDRLIAGDPVFTTWNLEQSDRLFAGIWRATPGKWRIVYDEWEYCRIRSGISVITDEIGLSRQVGTGEAFVLRAGFTGTWEVIETTTKDYVIRL